MATFSQVLEFCLDVRSFRFKMWHIFSFMGKIILNTFRKKLVIINVILVLTNNVDDSIQNRFGGILDSE